MRVERCRHARWERYGEDALVAGKDGVKQRANLDWCADGGAVRAHFASGETHWLEPRANDPLNADASIVLLFGGCGCKVVQA